MEPLLLGGKAGNASTESSVSSAFVLRSTRYSGRNSCQFLNSPEVGRDFGREGVLGESAAEVSRSRTGEEAIRIDVGEPRLQLGDCGWLCLRNRSGMAVEDGVRGSETGTVAGIAGRGGKAGLLDPSE